MNAVRIYFATLLFHDGYVTGHADSGDNPPTTAMQYQMQLLDCADQVLPPSEPPEDGWTRATIQGVGSKYVNLQNGAVTYVLVQDFELTSK